MIKINYLSIIALLLLIEYQLYGKDKYHPPEPENGIEYLKNIIDYPDYLWKAGIETSFKIQINIDSIGHVISYNLKPLFKSETTYEDSAFFLMIVNKFNKIKWHPARMNKHKINSSLSIPFLFILKDNDRQFYDSYIRNDNRYKIYHSKPVVVTHEKGFICID